MQTQESPAGIITFLFTDLESSTDLWEEYPEEMKISLARHDAILKSAVEGEGGFIVKTTGDGLHAAFPSAIDAVNAVLTSQLALISEQWGATGPLRVRMISVLPNPDHKSPIQVYPSKQSLNRITPASRSSSP